MRQGNTSFPVTDFSYPVQIMRYDHDVYLSKGCNKNFGMLYQSSIVRTQ